jgi:hypothetical protein
MIMNKRIVSVMAGTVLGAVLLGGASPSFASGTRTFHGSLCKVVSGSVALTSAGQVANTSTSTNAVLWCPVIGDPTLGFPINSTVTLDGWSNGGNNVTLYIQVCATPAAGGPPICQGSSGSSGPRNVYHVPAYTPAAGPSDSVYAIVMLGPAIGTDQNTLFGYHLDNP